MNVHPPAQLQLEQLGRSLHCNVDVTVHIGIGLDEAILAFPKSWELGMSQEFDWKILDFGKTQQNLTKYHKFIIHFTFGRP